MSKKKKVPETEGKYEAMCKEYQEREELESLNRKTRSRVKQIEETMHARLVRQMIQEAAARRRTHALGQLILTIILTMTICVALAVIAWVEMPLRPVLCIFCAVALLAGTFRTGFFWNEFVRN